MEDLQHKENQVEQLIQAGNKDEAVAALFELICAHAKRKDFTKAEALREKLMAVDAMALKAIVDSAEIIESEKAQGIDNLHVARWKDLYTIMSEEEKNAFYYALKHFKLEPGKEVIAQGKLNNHLYMINSGMLKVVVGQGDRETFLCEIGKNEIIGDDTFFPITVCTNSVIVESQTDISCIERKAVSAIDEKYPGFEAKLEDFCLKRQRTKVEEILKEKEVERRQFQRYKFEGRVHAMIVDKEKKPIGAEFNGSLEDLSSGGVSFLIKCSQKETARMLLGRRAFFDLSIQADGKKVDLKGLHGIIIGALFQLFSDYSVHVRFSQRIDESDLQKLVALGGSG